MKMSIKRELGHIQVRARRILKVVTEHKVGGPERARPGDLAFELQFVETGKIIGTSYISGEALNLSTEGPPQEDRFEPASIAWAAIGEAGETEAAQAVVLRSRLSAFDLVCFELDGIADPLMVGQFITQILVSDLRAVNPTTAPAWMVDLIAENANGDKANVLGVVAGRTKKGVATIHLERSSYTGPAKPAITPFFAQLAVNAVSNAPRHVIGVE